MKPKRVFVCSPYRADGIFSVEYHKGIAQGLCCFILFQGNIPIAPHLFYTSMLDDDNPRDREMGLRCSRSLLETCDEIVVYPRRTSEGMKREIAWAEELGIKRVTAT